MKPHNQCLLRIYTRRELHKEVFKELFLQIFLGLIHRVLEPCVGRKNKDDEVHVDRNYRHIYLLRGRVHYTSDMLSSGFLYTYSTIFLSEVRSQQLPYEVKLVHRNQFVGMFCSS